MLLLPAALAGTAEAPEVTDAADDCAFPPGNHYADIVSAWVSDETATSFVVNLALSKWTVEDLGVASGYTLQFTHQGIQFGVVAFYQGTAFGGWSYQNGYVDVDTGELANFTQAEGSFTPGSPALLSIAFDKSHFPHGDAADNRLVGFRGGSADFKPPFPVYVAEGVSGQDVPAEPDFLDCDLVESAATYTFQVGGHSAHSPAGAPGAANATADAAANATRPGGDPVSPAAAPDPAEANGTPGAAPLLAVALAALAALARRRGR